MVSFHLRVSVKTNNMKNGDLLAAVSNVSTTKLVIYTITAVVLNLFISFLLQKKVRRPCPTILRRIKIGGEVTAKKKVKKI